ncbi:hypothetical protein HMPREF2609_03130 [Rothia sp. HMSC058E10]|nr:hypothetical protein HMPREF2609_03130 [Rothia sp. HMSC058E10]
MLSLLIIPIKVKRAYKWTKENWPGEKKNISGGIGSIIMGILGSLKIKVVLISRLDLMLQMMVRTVLVGMGVWVSIKNLLMMVGLNLSGRRLRIICSVIPAP